MFVQRVKQAMNEQGISQSELVKLDVKDEDFGNILNCAVRYACCRETYILSLVINFIRPLLLDLSPRTLGCTERDLREANSYGNEIIDKPLWIEFLKEIRQMMNERNIEIWN